MTARAFVPADVLGRLIELQAKSSRALFAANACRERADVRAAAVAYRETVAITKQWLAEVLAARRSFGDAPALEVGPIVSVLLDAMLIEADLERSLGDEARGRELTAEALAVAREYLSPLDVAERERQCVSSHVTAGRFNEALVSLSNVRDVFLREGAPVQRVASVTSNMAELLEWLGDEKRALDEVSSVLSRLGRLPAKHIEDGLLGALNALMSGGLGEMEKARDAAEITRIRLELEQTKARILSARGDLVEAEQIFARLLPAVPALAQPAIEAQVVKIRVRQRRYDEALAELRKLMPAFDRPDLRPKRGVLRIYEAEALLGLNRPERAAEAAEEAVTELDTYHDTDALWKAWWLRGRALEACHRASAALEAYATAMDIVTSLRKAPLGFRLDSLYLRDKMPLFSDAIALAAKTGAAETCCRFVELVKSRTLTATMSVAARPQPQEDDLTRAADRLARSLDALEYEGLSVGWSDTLERRKAELTAERAAILERIRFSDPRWRSMSEPIPFDLDRLGELLASRNQAVLTLWQNGDRIVAVLLKERRCRVEELALAPAVQRALATYAENLESAKSPSMFDLSEAFDLGADALIPPHLLEEAVSSGGLVICPHHGLHLVPWPGMKFGGRRLFELCPVSIVPNLSCITAIAGVVPAKPRVGLIGAPRYAGLRKLSPLAAALAELATIREIYSSAGGLVTEPLTEARATEDNFWKLMQDKGASGAILHIACHGEFDRADPMSSGLLLEDGKADAAEIASKRLVYDEVVLSACSTGRRPTLVEDVALVGDDILGLPGAFLEAGAKAVLVSIPPAPDSASLAFFTLYHEGRAEGRPPLLALQEAQKGMLVGQMYPAWMWVGFTLYGA